MVASLARPAQNITGLSNQQVDLSGKRLELLREVAPSIRQIAIMNNPGNRSSSLETRNVQTAARSIGLEVIISDIRQGDDIDRAFESLKGCADALFVVSDPLMNVNRVRLNTLALSMRLPVMHGFREYTEAGALMSYGPNFQTMFRRTAEYVDKILREAKPSELPVEQPTKFELVINLTTAKALGLTIPPTLLARADEVIE